MNGPRLKMMKVTAGRAVEPHASTVARLAAGGIGSARPRGRHDQSGEKTGCERDVACVETRGGASGEARRAER